MKRTKLTLIEDEVVRLVAIGKTNQQIADLLGKSKRTIDGQVSKIFLVLKVKNRVEVATWAEKHGLKEDK